MSLAAMSGALSGYAPQSPADTDAKEIAAYRLTPAGLTKVINVNRSLVRQVMQEPKVQESLKLGAEIEALARKGELSDSEQKRIEELAFRKQQLDDAADNPLGGNAQSLGEMEARISSYAPMLQALQREGLSPREYAKFWLSFLKAAFAHGFQKSGMLKELPPDVNPENVRFVAEHQAEIEAMQKEFDALGRRKQ